MSRDTAQRRYEEIFTGSMPRGRFDDDGPMLAIAGTLVDFADRGLTPPG